MGPSIDARLPEVSHICPSPRIVVFLLLLMGTNSAAGAAVATTEYRQIPQICDINSADPLNACSYQELEKIHGEQIALRDKSAVDYINAVSSNIESRCMFYYVARDEAVNRVKQGLGAAFNEQTLDRCVQDIKQFKYYSRDWPQFRGYEDLYLKRDADQKENPSRWWEIEDAYISDWTNRFLSRYPEVANSIKAAAESYNSARQKVIVFSDLLKKKTSYITYPPVPPSQTPSTTRPMITVAPKSKSKTPAKKSQTQRSTQKILIRITCELRQFGLTSNWNGPMYIYTTYKYWSDGSRTFGPSGSGYLNQLPAACL